MENLRDLLNSFNKKDYPEKVNLHIHTKFSDGEGNAEQILASAKEKGYKLISITDHNTMEAVMTEEVEGIEPGMVIDVLQKGYTYKDRVVRPAMVKVNE